LLRYLEVFGEGKVATEAIVSGLDYLQYEVLYPGSLWELLGPECLQIEQSGEE